MHRRLILFALTILGFSSISYAQLSVAQSWKHLDTLFSKHVTKEGLVEYRGMKFTDDHYIYYNNAIAAADLNRFRGNDLKAHLINAYNFSVIKNVMRFYPTSSVKEISGFFDKLKYMYGKQKLTLNQIEKGILFQQFKDPRMHFVLNCGAISCPPLRQKAYRSATLDEEIDAQTRLVLNDTNFVMIDTLKNQLKLSMIFKWYEQDFNDAGGVLLFLNQYLKQPATYGLEIVYRAYDWSLNDASVSNGEEIINVQNFTPSVLLGKGRFEYKAFVNMYTETRKFTQFLGKQVSSRATYLTTINQFNVGINGRINIGAEFWTKNVLDGGPKTQNALNVFTAFGDTAFRAAPLYIGPKIKISPIKSAPHLSIQSTFLIPIASDFEGRLPSDKTPGLFLEWDRYLWINELFYDSELSDKWQLFLKVAAWTSIPRNSYRQNAFVDTPISGFLSYFPNSRLTFYGMAEYWPNHTRDNAIAAVNFNRFQPFNSYFFQMGLGAKMQVIPSKMELEFLTTDFLLGTNKTGAGRTFNVGLRVLGLLKQKASSASSADQTGS